MKLWLFDILACPIDKHFPLKLYIFSFENISEEFQALLNIYQNRDLTNIKDEKIINTHLEKGEYFIKDNIVFEFNKIENYFRLIISSIDEFKHILNRTNSPLIKACFKTIKSEIKTNILAYCENLDFKQIEKIVPELYFLNKFKFVFEIESGILFCNKCKRWYPIIETIPQMLPDDYRDEKKDITFLKNNKNLLNAEFLNQDLKPFNI